MYPSGDDESSLERWLRRLAPPVALVLAFLVVRSAALGALVRVVDTMWLHELGHAITAWLSGFNAFPGPWRTSIDDARSPLFVIVVATAIAGLGVFAHRRGLRRLRLAAGALLVVQLALTLGLKAHAAKALITFGGDAGPLVLGTALFGTFFAAPGSYLQVSRLRWGFLVLGTLAFADIFSLWWRARRDHDVIPFGEIEGVGHSDPTVLVDVHGWSVPSMVGRYVTLGVTCLIVMAALYVVYGLLSASSAGRD